MIRFESLERRQLMSLVVDLRLAGGGKEITVDHVGQIVSFDVFATITGTNASGNDEALDIGMGSFLSDNVGGGAAAGTLSIQRAAPFNNLGSQDGTQADLDGDGDLDVGSNITSSAAGFYVARSGAFDSVGVVEGASQRFKIATGSFTVTHLFGGRETDLDFRVRNANTSFLYNQDGVQVHDITHVSAGAPLVIHSTGGPIVGSIAGSVFDDANADGVRGTVIGGAEKPLTNWGVYLDKNKNGLLDTGETRVNTDANGNYSFPLLPAGTYRVRELLSSGYRRTTPASGFYDVTLGAGQLKNGLLFGNSKLGSISGTVFKDLDGDGVRDSGEIGLSGWRVFDDANGNGKFDANEASVLTDASGNYALNLTAGFHTIKVQQQSGYKLTTALYLKILLGESTKAANKLFGEKPVA